MNKIKITELKVRHNNLERRSGHKLVFYENRLYSYGGFELDQNLLEGLISIGYQNGMLEDEWKLYPTSQNSPNKLAFYVMTERDGILYIHGGLSKATSISSMLYKYSIQNDNWLEPIDGKYLVHSHTAEKLNGYWIIMFGFDQKGETCSFSNSCYSYDFKQTITRLETIGLCPSPRTNAASVVKDDKIFIHGGISQNNQVLADLWSFCNNQWTQILYTPRIHRLRHSINNINGELIIFAGADEEHKETNTLYSIDKDTSKQLFPYIVSQNIQLLKKTEKLNTKFKVSASAIKAMLPRTRRQSTEHIKLPTEQIPSQSNQIVKTQPILPQIILPDKPLTKDPVGNSLTQRQYISRRGSVEGIKSLPRISQDSRTRSTSQSKIDITKESESVRQRSLHLQQIFKKMLYQSLDTPRGLLLQSQPTPTTNEMKNIILQVSNINHWNKYMQHHTETEAKLLTAHVKQFTFKPRVDVDTYMERDGHATCVINNKFIVFGGDRNRLSFNDIHEISL